MKTFVLILILIAVAVAVGLSFVLQAGASPGRRAAVSLDTSCGPLMLESGVDTLVTCDIVARNGSTDDIADAVFSFQPAGSMQIPDAYNFISASVDGIDHTVSPYRLDYDLGHLAAGHERRAQVRVIVRSTRDYGADIVLRDATTLEEFDRRTIETTVFDSTGAPEVVISFATSTIENYENGELLSSIVGVQIHNRRPNTLHDVEVELALGPEALAMHTAGVDWTFTADRGRAFTRVEAIDPGTIRAFYLEVEPVASDCVYFTPSAVLWHDGEVTAKMGIEGFATPQGCDTEPSQGGGGVTVVGLPVAGVGTTPVDRDVAIVFVLWVGAALVLAGAAVPRSRR